MESVTIDMSALVDGDLIDAADVRTPLNNLKSALEDTLNGEQPFAQLNLGNSTEVTISGGAIDISGLSFVRVDTEGNAATDDLTIINGGSEGDVLYLTLENDARYVTIKHLDGISGNIYFESRADFLLIGTATVLRLFYTGTYWQGSESSSTLKNTLDATRAPRETGTLIVDADDILAGYSVGSLWYDVDHDNTYACLDNSVNAAVWKRIDNEEYACLRDVKGSGTDGGTFTAGAWQARILNDGGGGSFGISRLPFTSGGTFVPVEGDIISGASDVAFIVDIELTSGSWAGGDAAGNFWLSGAGTLFGTENVSITRGTVTTPNVASVTPAVQGQLRVRPGTYRFKLTLPAYAVNNHQGRFYNVTDGANIAYGQNAKSASGALTTTTSIVVGEFSVGTSTTYEIQHRCQTTKATDGLGLSNGFGGSEVYTIAEFWRS